jgi:hypothetical protein
MRINLSFVLNNYSIVELLNNYGLFKIDQRPERNRHHHGKNQRQPKSGPRSLEFDTVFPPTPATANEAANIPHYHLPPDGPTSVTQKPPLVVDPRRVALLARELVNHFATTKNALGKSVARSPFRHAFAYPDHAFRECSSRASSSPGW